MRISSKHSAAQRIAAAPDDPTAQLDCYETPAVAVEALVRVEREHMPHTLWEPAAGPGAIVRALRKASYVCHASDVYDYGQLPGLKVEDYLAETTVPPIGVAGIVTNPPFFAAEQFVEKAIRQVPYSAFLLRIQWLESTKRLPFFRATPPARVWDQQPPPPDDAPVRVDRQTSRQQRLLCVVYLRRRQCPKGTAGLVRLARDRPRRLGGSMTWDEAPDYNRADEVGKQARRNLITEPSTAPICPICGQQHTHVGKWHPKWADVPHTGWKCVGVKDLGDVLETCQMCESEHIRYVQIMRHDDLWVEPGDHGHLRCGCVCAGHMEGDINAARARDAAMRKAARAAKKKEAYRIRRSAEKRRRLAIAKHGFGAPDWKRLPGEEKYYRLADLHNILPPYPVRAGRAPLI